MNILINKNEVLRYLGYKGQDYGEDIHNLIDECIEEVKSIIEPKYIYRYFNTEINDEVVNLENTSLELRGKDINKHLSNSKVCVLMIATLGNKIEQTTRLYERSNLTKALIMDACATTAIEEVCDYVEGIVKNKAKEENKNITFRYSPGYGDLDLDIQNDFIKVMDASRKIGVVASSHNLLFPRKSVTAIIGIIDNNIKVHKRNCKDCNKFETCTFRKEGDGCGI